MMSNPTLKNLSKPIIHPLDYFVPAAAGSSLGLIQDVRTVCVWGSNVRCGLLLALLVLLFQKVPQGFFDNLVDRAVLVDGELLHCLEKIDIEAGCERLSLIHDAYIIDHLKKVNGDY